MDAQSRGKGSASASVLVRGKGCSCDNAEKAAWRGSACDQAEGAGGCAKRPASCAAMSQRAVTLFALCDLSRRSAYVGEVPADGADLLR
jgi:hypothetical protein